LVVGDISKPQLFAIDNTVCCLSKEGGATRAIDRAKSICKDLLSNDAIRSTPIQRIASAISLWTMNLFHANDSDLKAIIDGARRMMSKIVGTCSLQYFVSLHDRLKSLV
jgi:hypothetical protein